VILSANEVSYLRRFLNDFKKCYVGVDKKQLKKEQELINVFNKCYVGNTKKRLIKKLEANKCF
jgi:hypothetical protein